MYNHDYANLMMKLNFETGIACYEVSLYYANIMFDAYLCLLQRMQKIIYADVIGTSLARAPQCYRKGAEPIQKYLWLASPTVHIL